MPEIQPPWDEYLRLQTRSSRRLTIDSCSWGLEEEMNLFLTNPAAQNSLARANASAARRERAQAQLRKKHAAELAPKPQALDKQLDARAALQRIERSVSRTDWELLLKIGQEFTQAEIAKDRGMKAGTMRAAVFQLRTQLHHLRPAA
jgi:hypothetical protein